jgi:protein-tyrosine phosphatase
VIDLHCHILPGLDDGARDLNDSVGMARQAQADGIEAICATPHIRHDHDVRISELPARLDEVRAAIAAAGCATAILAGGEIAATALDGLDDSELAAVSLGGGGRWILLEPPPGPLDERTAGAVADLAARGFRTLVAHPERHVTPDLALWLVELVRGGALVQATAAALLDERTRGAMLELARTGVIHVLGSDSHSSRAGRPVQLRAALRVLATTPPFERHLAWSEQAAPRAIVDGRQIDPPFQAAT